MLSRRGPVLIAVSLLLAVGAAYVANEWLLSKNKEHEAAPGTVPVAVAAIDIPFGTQVEPRHVAMIQMLEGTAPQGVFADAKAVEGKFARSAVLQGDLLRDADFTDVSEGSTLATVVAPNMRAVSVRVNDVVGVAGFLLPGNRVDVVSAYQQGLESKSETIVQNVKVLAVDQTASTNKNEPVVVRAVTLEVSPIDAERVVLAEQRGMIQLALRNPRDEQLAMLTPPPAPLPAAAPVTAPEPVHKVVPRPRVRVGAPPPSDNVTVIRGTEVGKETSKK